MSEPEPLTFPQLSNAIAGNTAAFRMVTRLQPAGGPGDKVFPPTYEGGKYATERRSVDGREADCVLLDSVQSQANRMEQALLAAYDRGLLRFPLLSVQIPSVGRITTLDAPHRIADAIFRDSLLGGKPFRESREGQSFTDARTTNATPLFTLCPTALIFGMWDSTGPRGGMGAKFARALVSEVVGLDVVPGKRTASRLDPLQIAVGAGPVYQHATDGWTLDPSAAVTDGKKKGDPLRVKDGKPSEINHGNVTPTIADGGFTIGQAVQTTVLSLPALRRLRFPLGEKGPEAPRDHAAQVTLAALALAAIVYQREEGYDLRSRCQLVPSAPPAFELVSGEGKPPSRFSLTAQEAAALLAEAVKGATRANLPWREQPIVLEPAPKLVELVKRSQALQARQEG